MRQIVGDRLDQKNYTNVYSGRDNYTIAGLPDKAISQTKWILGKSDKWFLGKVTFETISEKLTNKTIATAFSPITSGDYILTAIDYNIGSNARVSMGESNNDTFITYLFSPRSYLSLAQITSISRKMNLLMPVFSTYNSVQSQFSIQFYQRNGTR